MPSVIVIGSGLAGLVSAYISHLNGNKTIILEKLDKVGGNSIKASSGINFIASSSDNDLFIDDILSSGSYNNINLVKTLVNNSDNAKKFLADCGLKFNKIFSGGGHSVPRTHSISDDSGSNIGWILVNCLHNKVINAGIQIKLCSRVIDLDIEKNSVKGVICENEYIKCNKIILATGGYSCNNQLLKKYSNFPTTNNVSTTGDGIIMSLKNNINVMNLDDIQIHPTSFVDPLNTTNKFKFLVPEALRGLGGVLIDKTGKRFTNELNTRDKVTSDILNNPYHVIECPNVLLIVNENILEKLGKVSKFYTSKGLMKKFDNIQEISNKYDINFHNLQNSLKNQKSPYYVATVTPAIHYTMGGIEINQHSQVISKKGYPINGLYACGEVTTGVHGKNRLVGNSLLECVVFGIIAGNFYS